MAEHEAARYRKRLRDAETERDALAARVEALQRHHITGLLGRENVTADAVFTVAELAELLDGDGLPDPVKVTQAAAEAREALGVTPGLYVPAEGRLPATTRRRTFPDAFTPKENR